MVSGEAVRRRDCNTQICVGPVTWSANGTYISVSRYFLDTRLSR